MTPDSGLHFNTGVIRAADCYREAWQMIKPQFGMVFAVVLVGMIIGGSFSIVLGPMMCGIYLVMFDVQEGREARFERLFNGFRFFLPSFLLTVFIMLPVAVMLLLIYVPLIAMMLAGGRMSETELMTFLITTFAVETVFVILMVCFHTLLLFSFPLIVDKKLGVIAAIKWSAKSVWKNLGGLASLFGLGFLVSLAGMLLFCVGVYLVMPLIVAATAIAYRKIFPGTIASPTFSEPPPPFAYKDL